MKPVIFRKDLLQYVLAILNRASGAISADDKTVGNKNTCKTEFVESKDKRGNITKTRETICRDDPIVEPVYQQQLVNEVVDVNSSQRQLQITNCEIVSKSNGMFANVK